LSLVEIHKLCRSYVEGSQCHLVLEEADLSIEAGETIALLGRSGSGKSTLLNLISGIDRPDSGNVKINGINISQLPEPDKTLFRRQHIGFIYQFFNLIPTLSSAENIAMVLELNSFPAAEIKQSVEDILSAINLEHRGSAFPDQLSGGEQQRVAISRALIHKPLLVLADEPTGNLDAETGHKVLSLLNDLVKQNQSTLLIVTHSLAVAKTADRVITLQNGKLSEQVGKFAW